MERLDKYLSECGAGTRSQVKLLLKAGRIRVDGIPEKDGSKKLDPTVHIISLDDIPLNAIGKIVVMLNKPAGYITATEDRQQSTVMDLLPSQYRNLKLNPIGRLDKETEGLLLFTNDGELLHELISPSKEVSKVYRAHHENTASAEDVRAFADGLILGDGTKCRPAILKPLGPGESLITVCEGKYHQVRRMMASRGMHVIKLERISEGNLTLGDLPSGKTRQLTPEEIEALKTGHSE